MGSAFTASRGNGYIAHHRAGQIKGMNPERSEVRGGEREGGVEGGGGALEIVETRGRKRGGGVDIACEMEY